MNQAGKVLIKNLNTLITGRSSILATALSLNLLKKGGSLYSIDRKLPLDMTAIDDDKSGEKFTKGNLADSTFFGQYLAKIGPIDAMVNCAGIRKSYNYYLSYLLSKGLLDKMQANEINEYGCRGCIINLVQASAHYDDQYFREQDEFAKTYQIDTERIDDQVFELADQLTAARIRCNTIMVNEKVDPSVFANLVTHILEDQYVAGQVINMEDNLAHKRKKWHEVQMEGFRYPDPPKVPEEKYVPPTLSLPPKG